MTHLAASSRRMIQINNDCDQLVKAYHMQSAVIKRRHKQLNEQLVTTIKSVFCYYMFVYLPQNLFACTR